jgi:polyketide cyclase/dehydrase/lipid transport protein/DUF2934 family protein
MGTTSHSIEVSAPVRVVYNQWIQFEEFPRFMEGVEEIRRESATRLFWRTRIGGIEKSWEAEVTSQVPDERIAWQSIDGTSNAGIVTFEKLDPDRTKINVVIDYEPEGILEKTGDLLGIPSSRVEGDLTRFRDFVEQRQQQPGLSTPKQVLEPEDPSGWQNDFPISAMEAGSIESQGAPVETQKPKSAGVAAAVSPKLHDEKTGELPTGQDSDVDESAQFYRDAAVPTRPPQEEIAARAYELFLKRGSSPGGETEDWLQAEKELIEEYNS